MKKAKALKIIKRKYYKDYNGIEIYKFRFFFVDRIVNNYNKNLFKNPNFYNYSIGFNCSFKTAKEIAKKECKMLDLIYKGYKQNYYN